MVSDNNAATQHGVDSGAVRAADNALHVPVLLEECIGLLAPAFTAEAPVMIDATLGMGGHTFGFLTRFPHLTVVGIDRDADAIELASERLKEFGSRFHAVRTTYDHIDDVAAQFGRSGRVDGILMDLGVSSLQLDEESRGFSYSHDAPLDMRMDITQGRTAADILADSSVGEIARILSDYGDERFALKIARRVVSTRDKQPITRTSQLADLVKETIPAATRRTGGNPAKRTFQALRIDVNNEYEVLEAFMEKLPDALAPGGRAAILTFHSGEDRLVKKSMKGLYQIGIYSEYSKEVIRPSKEECIRNSRASSTKMRWAIKAE